MSCPVFDKKESSAKEIPYRTLFFRVDIALGRMFKRSIWASQKESHLSSVCLRPSYCFIADGLAKCTLYPCSLSASTNQYQLKADSTTTPSRLSLKGSRAAKIASILLGSLFL